MVEVVDCGAPAARAIVRGAPTRTGRERSALASMFAAIEGRATACQAPQRAGSAEDDLLGEWMVDSDSVDWGGDSGTMDTNYNNSGSLHDVCESEEWIDETVIDVRNDETVIDGCPRIRCHCTPGPGWRIEFRCRACPAPCKTRSKDGAVVHGRACTGALDMVRT